MTEQVRITDIDRIPTDPGIYLIFVDAQIGWLAWEPSSGPAYIGKADDGLRRRVQKEHVGDTGRSTLRRTLGALLKEQLALSACPRPSKGPPKAVNFTNFDFELRGNERLTAWMSEHVSIEARTGPSREVEKLLIAEIQPPLNLTGWPNPYDPEIRAARRECADEARRWIAPDD